MLNTDGVVGIQYCRWAPLLSVELAPSQAEKIPALISLTLGSELPSNAISRECHRSRVRVVRVRVRVGRSQPGKNPHPWHGFTNPWWVAGRGQNKK